MLLKLCSKRITCQNDPKRDLVHQGFARVGRADFSISPSLLEELSEIERSFERLPTDQYAGSRPCRVRRHTRYIRLPNGDLWPKTKNTYCQDPNYNPTDGGIIREFERLEPAIEAGP